MDKQLGKSASLAKVAMVMLLVLAGLNLLAMVVILGAAAAKVNLWTSGPGALVMWFFPAPLGVGMGAVALAAVVHLLQRRVEQGVEQLRLLELLTAGGKAAGASVPVTQAVASHGTGNPTLLTMAMAAAALPTEDKHGDPSRVATLELLQQIRDSALMTDTQKQECAKAHWAKRKEAVSRLVERHILSGDWASARLRVEELRTLLPEDPDVLELSEKLAGEHASRLTEDLTAARSQLRQLLSITAWQEAEEIVLSLQKKYPNDTQVGHLAADIAHERAKLERNNRERLLSDLANATENRQWRRAITAAEDFIQRYPADTYAERLQFDLPTLRENAAAADRKEQEQLFKDLLKRQRYEEAEGVARSLIEKYPASPAAAELLKMLPRVEELHRQEKLKRTTETASGV